MLWYPEGMRRVAILAVMLVGCGSFGASSPDSGSSMPSDTDAGPLEGGSDAGLLPDGATRCARPSFADGFDRAALQGGGWTAVPEELSGLVLATSDEHFSGSKSLKVQVSTRSAAASSFFEQQVGLPSCPITLSLHLRATKLPAPDRLLHLLSIELTDDSAIILSLRGGGFEVTEQTKGGPNTTPLQPLDATWRSIRLTYDPAALPRPTIDVVMDGSQRSFQTTLALGAMRTVRLGAVYADAEADGDVWMDAFSIE